MVSGSLSLPLPGFFFTFPSRYWSTIAHQGVFSPFEMVLDPSVRIPRVADVLRACLAFLHDFGYGSFTLFAAPSPALLLSCQIGFIGTPITPSYDGLGSSAFARHYLRNRSYFPFLQVLRCFSSLRIASILHRCHPLG